jgi:hypothetical protein
MNTWEKYYIQYFTHHNNIIEEQNCARLNLLFQLTYNLQAQHYIPNTQQDQSLYRHGAGRRQPQ